MVLLFCKWTFFFFLLQIYTLNYQLELAVFSWIISVEVPTPKLERSENARSLLLINMLRSSKCYIIFHIQVKPNTVLSGSWLSQVRGCFVSCFCFAPGQPIYALSYVRNAKRKGWPLFIFRLCSFWKCRIVSFCFKLREPRTRKPSN